jgi:hypothetical protein
VNEWLTVEKCNTTFLRCLQWRMKYRDAGLRLLGGKLANTGIIDLDGGSITGTGTLVNQTGRIVTWRVIIVSGIPIPV